MWFHKLLKVDLLIYASVQIAYQAGPNAKPIYALEGSSKSFSLT